MSEFRMKMGSHLPPNPKWIKHPSEHKYQSYKTYKISRKKQFDIAPGNNFLIMTPKAPKSEKQNKTELYKHQQFFTSKQR